MEAGGPEPATAAANGQPEIRTLLSRNKASLLRELESTNLLGVLLKRGVITELDRQALASSSNCSPDVDLFIELVQAKGFEAFREFCFALEAEAPHVLTDLLVVQHALTEEQERQQQQKQANGQSVNKQELQSKPAVDKHNEYSASAVDKDVVAKTATLRRPSRRSTSPSPSPPPPQPPPAKEPAYSSAGVPQQQQQQHACNSSEQPILEMLDEPVDEPVGGSERGWEVHHVTVTRVPGYGFGIAVSGGRDNPHFTNGDPAIAISDVLKAGPAEGKLQVNDRIISANGVSLEGADYGAAVRVLRDSGSTVLLVVKRRAGTSVSPASPKSASPSHHHHQQQSSGLLMGLPSGNALPVIGGGGGSPTSQSHRLSLTRPSKKDDFGIVLGCRLYIREVTREGTGARVGDLVTRIAGVSADNMSLKEARKLMDASKERLSLVVSREPTSGVNRVDPLSGSPSEVPSQLQLQHTPSKAQQPQQQPDYQSSPAYSSQNLYVPPPTRQALPPPLLDDGKSNLAPRGRSRGPLMDVSLSQLDLPATPTQQQQQSHLLPPRPPPPRPEDYYTSWRQMDAEEDPQQRSKQPVPDPRFITFQKEGSVGVRLTGGNETGVFVSAVQPGSPAALQGLQPGDKILKVNDMDMKAVSREEAVLFLLGLQEQIDLIVQHRRHEYEQIVASGKGDSFHVKTHFHYENPEKGEMSFRSGDVFHVVDTLHNGVVGSWQVYRIGRNNQEVQKGIIPNKARAEELATAQFNATKKEMSANESRGSFFRRRRGSHRRSKSLGRDHWDDVVFSDSVSKFPAYERVVLRHPGFIRPVVLFGPVADLARAKLLKDFPDKFTSPQTESQIEEGSVKSKTSGIIRLSAIREVMDRGKHALLDITPNAVDRLNYAQFYPIVIFLKAETKQVVKEMRAGIPKSAHKSSKKLLEQCQKLDKIWGHVFSAVITLTSPESWYRKLRELVDYQQQGPLWMSQTKPEEALSDDFLFPMTSRLSYASSPESDLEQSPAPPLPGALGVPSRLKSSSDPSIATQDDAVAPPPYSSSYQVSQLLQSLGSPPGDQQQFAPNEQQQQAFDQQHRRRSQHQHHIQQQQQQQQQAPPDLPPRLDRNSKATSPAARTVARSAQERLINKTDSVLEMANYINATPHRANASSLERIQAQGERYDSMSSYESFNTNGVSYSTGGLNSSTGRLGPNVPDDLKSSSMGARPHDPYRFTRSTAIPVQETQSRTDYAKYSRTGDYKSVPALQPKPGGTYKPVPPPKPKNYRPPQQQQVLIHDENNGANLYQHAKSYSMGTTSHMYNGAENGTSTQQQQQQQRNSGQYYYNITPAANRNMPNDNYSINSNHAMHNHSISHSHPMSSPPMTSHSHSNSSGQIGLAHSHNRSSNTLTMNGHSHSNSHSGIGHQNSSASANNNNNNNNREASNGLDLAERREQRGSAFELYRKPLHHHNMRNKGSARGTFGSEGGVLEGPGGVTLIVPPGALPLNAHQEVYFSVTDASAVQLQSNNPSHRSSLLSPPIHNGESMLSPLVECGPKGLEFRSPVELRIPHKATPAHRLALNATDTEDNSSTDWLNVKLPGPTSDHIIVRLDHF